MKRIIFTLIMGICLIMSGFAQKVDPKHENHYKDVAPLQTDDFTIEISDQHSQMEFTSVKIKITNKTADYLIYKPTETVFKYAHGDYKPSKGDVFIAPKESVNKVLKVTGDNRFHVESLSIEFNGFYRLPVKGTVFTPADFDLPASVNIVSAGPFEVNLLNVSKETKLTQARFKATYSGSNWALVDPSKIVCKIESGQEFANLKSKSKVDIIKGGEEAKFMLYYEIPASIVDMQFANMKLLWKDAFVESSEQTITGTKVDLVLDPGKTEGKNK